MHDVSLGQTIRDYLTGETIEQTTFEDLRQALARLLVEERGYPRDRIRPRVNAVIQIEGRDYGRLVDLVALDAQERPLLALMFCAGVVSTYLRESLAAARLMPGGPAPLVAVTDTREAMLLETATGKVLGQGMAAIPDWATLTELAAAHPPLPLEEEQREREARILYAYSEQLYSCCSYAACTAAARGGRFKDDQKG